MYRFAPSPTGDMHVGNLRAALFNYICAKQNNKKFILRIEDTDIARNIKGKEEEIFKILKRFNISWDELYYQSDNFSRHQALANKLVEQKKAFYCYCTKGELDAKKEEAKKNKKAYKYDDTCINLGILDNKKHLIRIKKPDEALSFKDEIKGEIKFEKDTFDSFVILRENKIPTYNFACAIDDMDEGITFIIRGEDHVSNTPKQEWIRKNLGFDKKIGYAHLPIILNELGSKMSKRDNASSINWLLNEGFLPSAIANYLILLGNKTPKEIFTIDEAIRWFDIKKISKSPAKFDIEKLRFINREHIKMLSDDKIMKEFSMDKKFVSLIKFYTQEASLINEIKNKILKIYSFKEIPDEYSKNAKLLSKEIDALSVVPNSFDEFKKDLIQKTNLKSKEFFMPLRLLLTGEIHGPKLDELYPFIKDDIKEIVKQ